MNAGDFLFSVLRGIGGLRVFWAAAPPGESLDLAVTEVAVVAMIASENFVDFSGPVPVRKTFGIDFTAPSPERTAEVVDELLVALRASGRLSSWEHILDAYDEDLNAHRTRLSVVILET